ncbi:uncharacterized protein C8Q71DRAFT_721217 [Rhodofomes roseus]|uniref:Uncharacterized protein n=1 Tax=Rhodofomes roseus TaxID=34475 RepID=A0ABQ8KQ29_9APHY|nr:uncharacterized protein C8Q71DRAFT_721217 [Rhodofomes roseus]KAH9840721.1 hypothetical protein C8Q71DRAFT_721217 [Rhodofomes roseus]
MIENETDTEMVITPNNADFWPPCPRNGIQFNAIRAGWEELSAPLQSSNPEIIKFLTSITRPLSEHAIIKCGLEMCHYLDEKLEAVLARCIAAKHQDTAASFGIMLSRIQLTCKVTSMLADKDRAYKLMQVIWDACLGHVEDAPVYREFNEMGHVNLSTDIGNLLRWPDDSEEGKMIRESIIPMVALLARTCPIKIGEIMQDSALLELNGVPAEILCSNLAVSDKLFKSVGSKHNAVWAHFDSISKSTPPPCDREESPLTVFSEESEPRSIDAQGDWLALAVPIPTKSAGVQVQTIATSYDPGHTDNSRFPACQDRNNNNEWTERARAEACGGSKPADLQELETM